MNRHIQQLVEQAPYTTISTEGRLFTQQDLAKFAELIVRECIGLLPEDCQSDNGCHASWTIKEHFGVEE